MIYNINEYDDLNEKLYKSGVANTISSDPIEIAKVYADAGVDISHYSPMDLAEAHNNYSDYKSRVKDAEYEAKENIRLQREYEAEQERLNKEAEHQAYLDELDREHEEYIQDLIDKGEYVGDYNDETKQYLELCCDYKEELFQFLRSKGAYADDDVTETGLYGRVLFDAYHGNICYYNKKENKYEYGFVCDVEKVMYYEMPYFDWDAWEEFQEQADIRRDILKEYEVLKTYQYKTVEDKEVEELARFAFTRVKLSLDKLEKTGTHEDRKEGELDYRLTRKLAFDNDPKAICERIGKVMRNIFK